MQMIVLFNLTLKICFCHQHRMDKPSIRVKIKVSCESCKLLANKSKKKRKADIFEKGFKVSTVVSLTKHLITLQVRI